jgi:magnesium transporter
MFVPMIAATSGNAGIQTATIVLRGFATGDLAGSKLRVVFSREVRIAILVGVLCATMTGGLTALMIGVMKGRGYTVVMPDEIHAFRIGISVSLGMLCAIGESVSFGIALPFLFKRVGVDPAIASGPLITSANDLLSVSVYLGIALLILY